MCVLSRVKTRWACLHSSEVYSFLVCADSEINRSLRGGDLAGYSPSCHINLLGVGQVLSLL